MAKNNNNEKEFDLKSVMSSKSELTLEQKKQLLEELSQDVTEEEIALRQKEQKKVEITNYRDPRVVPFEVVNGVAIDNCIFNIFNNKTGKSFNFSGVKTLSLLPIKHPDRLNLIAKKGDARDGRIVHGVYRIKFMYAVVGIED